MKMDMEQSQKQSISLISQLQTELLTVQTEKQELQEAYDRLKPSVTYSLC